VSFCILLTAIDISTLISASTDGYCDPEKLTFH